MCCVQSVTVRAPRDVTKTSPPSYREELLRVELWQINNNNNNNKQAWKCPTGSERIAVTLFVSLLQTSARSHKTGLNN